MKYSLFSRIVFIFLYVSSLRQSTASEVVMFGYSEEIRKEAIKGLPVFITEGSVVNKIHYSSDQLFSEGEFINDGSAQKNHPDKVADIVFQIHPSAHISGTSVSNMKRNGIFNYSYGMCHQVIEGGRTKEKYTEVQQSLVDIAGYEGFGDIVPTELEQLYFKSAGNDFRQGATPDTYDGKYYKGERYKKYIKGLIKKFNRRIVFCSQMSADGADISAGSGRALRDNHKQYYICCPMPVHTGNDNKFLIGTSFAAPMVSGLAARLHGDFPKLSLQEVRDIILISASKFYLKWSETSCKLEIIEMSGRRFGNGLLNAENAYSLARKVSFTKKGKKDYCWETIFTINAWMPKQVVIYPVLNPDQHVICYKSWLAKLLPGFNENEINNVYKVLQSIKISDVSKLAILTDKLSVFMNELVQARLDYQRIFQSLSELINYQHLKIQDPVKNLYSTVFETVNLSVIANKHFEVFCRFFFSVDNLDSNIINDVLLRVRQANNGQLINSHEEFIALYERLLAPAPLVPQIILIQEDEAVEPLKKKRHFEKD